MLHDCLLKNLYGFFLMFFKEIYWDWNSTGYVKIEWYCLFVCLIVLVIIHVFSLNEFLLDIT